MQDSVMLTLEIMNKSRVDASNERIAALTREIAINAATLRNDQYRVISERLAQAESELADARDLIASQTETIEALENKITALQAIIRADTPASVVDENHPLTWTPTEAERVEWRRIFAHGHHFCACECGCENHVDKPDTLCRTCLPI